MIRNRVIPVRIPHEFSDPRWRHGLVMHLRWNSFGEMTQSGEMHHPPDYSPYSSFNETYANNAAGGSVYSKHPRDAGPGCAYRNPGNSQRTDYPSYNVTNHPIRVTGSNLSCAVWVKISTTSGLPRVFIGKHKSPTAHTANYFSFSLQHNTGNKFRFWVAITAPAFGAAQATTHVPRVDEWVHHGGTYDGTTIRNYINGYLDGTAALGAGAGVLDDHAYGLGVGANGGHGEVLNGEIAEVMVWNRTLSDGEMAELANPSRRVVWGRRRSYQTIAATSNHPLHSFWQGFPI